MPLHDNDSHLVCCTSIHNCRQGVADVLSLSFPKGEKVILIPPLTVSKSQFCSCATVLRPFTHALRRATSRVFSQMDRGYYSMSGRYVCANRMFGFFLEGYFLQTGSRNGSVSCFSTASLFVVAPRCKPVTNPPRSGYTTWNRVSVARNSM